MSQQDKTFAFTFSYEQLTEILTAHLSATKQLPAAAKKFEHVSVRPGYITRRNDGSIVQELTLVFQDYQQKVEY